MLISLSYNNGRISPHELFSVFLNTVRPHEEIDLRCWIDSQPFEVYEFEGRTRTYYMRDPDIYLLIKMMFPDIDYYVSYLQPPEFDAFMEPIRRASPFYEELETDRKRGI